jgi:hypothetical protein
VTIEQASIKVQRIVRAAIVKDLQTEIFAVEHIMSLVVIAPKTFLKIYWDIILLWVSNFHWHPGLEWTFAIMGKIQCLSFSS